MLEKLMIRLGYISKTQYDELETTLKESEKTLKEYTDSLDEKDTKISSLKRQLEYCTDVLEEQVVENNSLKTTINNLQQKNNKLSKLLKETKRKEFVLLRKQGNLKEEISEREADISCLIAETHYLNQKVKLLESYNYAVITKLEELCFGSVLPKVMKQTDLSKYLHPLKPIKVVWSKENGDIRVEALGVPDTNEIS